MLGGMLAARGAAEEGLPGSPLPVVTNVLQFHLLTRHAQRASCALRLEGVVRWADPAKGLVVLEDESGAALVETDPQAEPVHLGQRVMAEGNCSGTEAGAALRIGRRLLVDSDGIHGMQEESGKVFLKAGKHPISVTWFDGNSPYGLEVYYQGPGLPRQRVPGSALFRWGVDPASGARSLVQGVDYRTFEGQRSKLPALHQLLPPNAVNYEGQWSGLPNFRQLSPVKIGSTTNFDLIVQTQDKNVALEFAGYIEVPRDGLYTFSTVSAGGSQLFIELPRLQAVGTARLAEPRRMATGQVFSGEEEAPWAEVEGMVTFTSDQESGGLKLELTSGTGRMRVEVGQGSSGSAGRLLGSRVRVSGICRSASTLDGQMIPGVLWTPSLEQIELLEGTPEIWSVSLDGGRLPLLTTVAQIKRLKREEAMRGYPVKIRGVITWSSKSAVIIQDSTMGIYVEAVAVRDSYPLRVGEYWEVEGVTTARFSPTILSRRAVRLGIGTLPEPAHPVRDQLLNGTMDAQYVEIQGVVTAVENKKLRLITRDGTIQVHVTDMQPEAIGRYEGAQVRVRGCLCAVKDSTTHEFKVGEIEMRCASINVDQAPPADPFAAPAKHVAELLLFDAQAAAFQPVKVTGQVVHESGGEYCLTDGAKGLRFIPKAPIRLRAGDLVEVVGFPEFGGPSPVLREAVARQTGRSTLPQAKRLEESGLLDEELDSTLVEVEAQLINLSSDRAEQVLGLQAGSHVFVARLKPEGRSLLAVPIGSRLKLTGVYAGRGGEKTADRKIDSFELLLNSVSDLQVLARPSWWTFNRLLAIVGVMVGVIAVALVWVGLLRRQVEQRTAQLQDEIQQREQVEHQRGVEAERSRIARDLHDDLGSSLTEISLLADAGPGSPPTLDRAGGRFRLIAAKARALVEALDVIVWLVNPRKDALPFLAGYLANYTEEFLSASGLACHLNIPLNIPSAPLTSEIRHGLFLAVKEALRNVVRHAQASEVVMELAVREGEVEIAIADNGRGFDPSVSAEGNGLTNLRERLAGIGGRCEITSKAGIGTRVSLALPLSEGLNET